MPARQRFFVDLKDGETTVVSWKKLTNDAEKNMSAGVPSDAPAGANPALEARIAPEVQVGSPAVNFDVQRWGISLRRGFVLCSLCSD
jgi:ubinuclein